MGDDDKKAPDETAGFRAFAEMAKGFTFDRSPIERFMASSTLTPPKLPTMEERFDFASAEAVITDLVSRIRRRQEAEPGRVLVVAMRTPDGSLMDVAVLAPEGFATFRAEGYVNGMPCFVIGHISTLSLFCAFKEEKGKHPLGFTAPQSEPEPKAT